MFIQLKAIASFNTYNYIGLFCQEQEVYHPSLQYHGCTNTFSKWLLISKMCSACTLQSRSWRWLDTSNNDSSSHFDLIEFLSSQFGRISSGKFEFIYLHFKWMRINLIYNDEQCFAIYTSSFNALRVLFIAAANTFIQSFSETSTVNGCESLEIEVTVLFSDTITRTTGRLKTDEFRDRNQNVSSEIKINIFSDDEIYRTWWDEWEIDEISGELVKRERVDRRDFLRIQLRRTCYWRHIYFVHILIRVHAHQNAKCLHFAPIFLFFPLIKITIIGLCQQALSMYFFFSLPYFHECQGLIVLCTRYSNL